MKPGHLLLSYLAFYAWPLSFFSFFLFSSVFCLFPGSFHSVPLSSHYLGFATMENKACCWFRRWMMWFLGAINWTLIFPNGTQLSDRMNSIMKAGIIERQSKAIPLGKRHKWNWNIKMNPLRSLNDTFCNIFFWNVFNDHFGKISFWICPMT